jgi:hypothetical protein
LSNLTLFLLFWYQNNRNKVRFDNNERNKKRSKTDPSFKLRNNISSSIAGFLKKNDSSKNGQSCLNYLPYSFDELKQHLESQFEPWMTWENQGKYSVKIWNDNDPTTWTWQLDHIIPHSTFNYFSMDCQEFRDCWELSNLRPLSAKQNVIDGTKRTRHISKSLEAI